MAAKEISELDNGVPNSKEHYEITKNEIRKSDRQRKVVKEYADYFDDLHLGRLKSDLSKLDKEIEAITHNLSGLDAKHNRISIRV